MTVEISSRVPVRTRSDGSFSVKSVDLGALRQSVSPLLVVDDFRVRGQPFGPHPHAGFAAVTYVFEDSSASLRSRDSLGHDLVVGPGGMVWSHAGKGMLHEELPADLRQELHGLQFFVNLQARNKVSPAHVFQLLPHEVPVWTDEHGTRVRVVVGSFRDRLSPLVPPEPFTLLDVNLASDLPLESVDGYSYVVYVIEGSARVRADHASRNLVAGEAVAFQGTGSVTLSVRHKAHLLILSGRRIDEPVVFRGPFAMNTQQQIADAFARFESGSMGHLAPYPLPLTSRTPTPESP